MIAFQNATANTLEPDKLDALQAAAMSGIELITPYFA